MSRHRVAALAATALLAAATPLRAQGSDQRATVAVLYFTNSALVRHEEFEPLSKGVTEMLITELAGSPSLQVVERDRLQSLLEEQDLARSGKVDQETAVRLGKLLGAQHLLMGGFIVDPRNNMRLDLRAVSVETSKVEYVETVSGKSEDLLDLVAKLGAKVNQHLRLPPIASQVAPAGGKTSKPDQLRAVMLLSRALEENDKGNIPGAMALYRQALDVYPDYTRAKVLLASLETSQKP
jgi:TolB-like protein